MKPAFILLLLAFLSGCAHQDEWTRRDTMMQIGVTVVMIGDAITTARIKDCQNCYEGGPIAKQFLGPQPSTSDTAKYFVTGMIFSAVIARMLPANWRPYWQTLEIGVHSYAIKNNCDTGLC